MKEKIFIYGAGGLGREVLGLIRSLATFEAAGFFDDGIPAGRLVAGLPVTGNLATLQNTREVMNVVIAVGNPAVKASLFSKLHHTKVRFPALVHPGAILQEPESIHIGPGTIITAGCILTTNIQLGNHVLINLNTTLGHDVSIGDCSSVMPGTNIAGSVSVGKSVLIGSGANIINGVSIGDRCRIGMGSVVLRNVETGITVAGIPAKPLA